MILPSKELCDEDYEMLARENKSMAEYLLSIGLTNEQINDIANGCMLKEDTKMSKEFTLTKKEFIERSMKGEVFIDGFNNRLFYDNNKENPFRYCNKALHGAWEYFDGKALFTLEKPKPIIERRWKWRLDEIGRTIESHYLSNEYAEKYDYTGWYKTELYIDVKLSCK